MHLGASYAQLLNLVTTPDLSSAQYKVDSGGTQGSLDVFRLPYQSKWLSLTPATDLYWRIGAGYLTYRETYPLDNDNLPGDVSNKWSAYSLSTGTLARTRFGEFTLEPSVDVSVARLLNHAAYAGSATFFQPLLDGPLFNWHTNAWSVTPGLGLDWTRETSRHRISITGHVAWSYFSSFNESPGLARFNETTGAYSVRAEFAQPTSLAPFGHPLDWLVRTGYGGFWGSNRQALDFSSVAEVGVGVETPLRSAGTSPERLRLGASYLFGPHIRGWTVNLGLRY